MAAYLFRLMALLALALMPFGMTGGAATAQPAAAAETGHCAGHDREQGPEQAPGQAHASGCLACAGLPPLGVSAAAEAIVPAVPRLITAEHAFEGIEPDIATPPPRRA